MLSDEGNYQGSNEDDELSERKIYSRRPVKGLLINKNDNSVFRDSNKQPQTMVSDVHRPDFEPDPGTFYDGFSGKNGFMAQENKIMISLSKKSKREALELRRKLEDERDLVRSLMRKIESNEGQKHALDSGSGHDKVSKPVSQLSVSVDNPVSDNTEKEKRTPKANKFYRNTEFLLAKDKFPHRESNKKLKSNAQKFSGNAIEKGKSFPSKVLKSCTALLERLMKHKHGWVFNKPVDAKALGLHDYFDVIKHPMDLGTVKERLAQNWYESPLAFVEDVRTTFRNAMTYNSKGQDVHVMAEQLLKIFEEKWAGIEYDYMHECKVAKDSNVGSRAPKSKKGSTKPRGGLYVNKTLQRSESVNDKKRKAVNVGRVSNPKKKPKAKDPDKREMTYDEKKKLSVNLQSLPSEKLENVVHIIKKRNPSLAQEDNEIEVDIDSVDIETLWELDRFVTNYKKSLSKNKRKDESGEKLTSETEENTMERLNAPSQPETPKGSRSDNKEKSVEEPELNDTKVDSQSSSTSNSGSSSRGSDGECSS